MQQIMMTSSHVRRFLAPHAWRVARAPLTGLVLFGLTACHGLLDVSDPTLIRDEDIANATGAAARVATTAALFLQYANNTARDVALFTDETRYDAPLTNLSPGDAYFLDQRDGVSYENSHQTDDPHLGYLDATVVQSTIAIAQVRRYVAAPLRGDLLGQLYAYRGYAILQMAEDVCSGFPINDATAEGSPVLSGPYSTDSAVAYAITQLDSALANVVDSTIYLNLARIAKGRALLDLGQYPEAATAVTAVPTGFVVGGDPAYGQLFYLSPSSTNIETPVGDTEGVHGLAFVSEHDPRVVTRYVSQSWADPADSLYGRDLGPSNTSGMIIASGIEARLIEAEAALNDNDGSWLTILNALRTPVGLAPLVDPGTADARVDLVYHERAFWLYNTGRRLGDLRRLIRNYGRTATTVFPTGSYHLGGTYQNATAIPFSLADESRYNKKITTGCAVR